MPHCKTSRPPVYWLLSAVISYLLALPINGYSTVVQFQTVAGTFEVVLFDEQVPVTVDNFLTYVEDQSYNNSIVHRSVENFIIQGGGYRINLEDGVYSTVGIPTNDSIDNEAYFSNVRGTIAMAKLNNDPHSATSQWFINLTNNSANLDVQNGGFTVFGQVIEPGMEVVEAIANYNTVNIQSFNSFPVISYSDEDAANGVELLPENFVSIDSIIVIDPTTVEPPSVMPDIIVAPQPTTLPEPESYGAGAFQWAWLLLLATLGFRGLSVRRVRI